MASELYVVAASGGGNQSFERSGLKLFPALRAEEHTGPAVITRPSGLVITE